MSDNDNFLGAFFYPAFMLSYSQQEKNEAEAEYYKEKTRQLKEQQKPRSNSEWVCPTYPRPSYTPYIPPKILTPEELAAKKEADDNYYFWRNVWCIILFLAVLGGLFILYPFFLATGAHASELTANREWTSCEIKAFQKFPPKNITEPYHGRVVMLPERKQAYFVSDKDWIVAGVNAPSNAPIKTMGWGASGYCWMNKTNNGAQFCYKPESGNMVFQIKNVADNPAGITVAAVCNKSQVKGL